MTSFFKKALGVFVEFDEDQNKEIISSSNPIPSITSDIIRNSQNHAEAEKFEKYFDRLFDQANLPGPDYFEFYKMMEALETHIRDENTRLSATFASLSIQGLTKQTLLDTANKYKVLVEKDKIEFERAIQEKLKSEVQDRQNNILDLQKRIAINSDQIQKLTTEISESQVQIGKLKAEVALEEEKQTKNSNGYQLASQAIYNKIATDIQKIQSNI